MSMHNNCSMHNDVKKQNAAAYFVFIGINNLEKAEFKTLILYWCMVCGILSSILNWSKQQTHRRV